MIMYWFSECSSKLKFDRFWAVKIDPLVTCFTLIWVKPIHEHNPRVRTSCPLTEEPNGIPTFHLRAIEHLPKLSKHKASKTVKVRSMAIRAEFPEGFVGTIVAHLTKQTCVTSRASDGRCYSHLDSSTNGFSLESKLVWLFLWAVQ